MARIGVEMAGRYRIVDLALWSDPVVEKLSAEEKLLFLYLITGPASHMSGIYKLRIGQIVADTGLSEKGVRRGIEGGSMGLLALYDDEFAVVWVVNMLAHQGRGANIAKHVGAHLLTLHNCPLIKDFLSRYEEMEIPYSNPLRTPFDGGVPQEQEQEQEQEQIQEQDPPSPPRGNGAVNRIFDQWVSIMGKNPKQAKLTPKRKRLVEARLAEGYTEQMLLEAIRGCQRSDHHMGNNERNRVYNSLELICRDGEHVEQFLDDQSGLSKGVKVSSARMLWNRNQEEDNGDPI